MHFSLLFVIILYFKKGQLLLLIIIHFLIDALFKFQTFLALIIKLLYYYYYMNVYKKIICLNFLSMTLTCKKRST